MNDAGVAKPLLLDLLPSWPGLQYDRAKGGKVVVSLRARLMRMLALLAGEVRLRDCSTQLNPRVLTSLNELNVI